MWSQIQRLTNIFNLGLDLVIFVGRRIGAKILTHSSFLILFHFSMCIIWKDVHIQFNEN